MTLTFGTTGMDRATEAAIHAAFQEANAACGNRWVLTGDDSAEYIVVDMDSLYGPMSWLKLHGVGRKVIGLTTAKRSKTPYRLPKPISADDLTVLLSEIAGEEAYESGLVDNKSTPPAAPRPKAEAAPAPVAATEPAVTTDSPPARTPSEPDPQPAAEAEAENAADVAAEPVVATVPETKPGPTATQTPRTLRGWLGARGAQRVRVTAKDGTTVLLDSQAGVWHGPKELKSAAPCFSAEPGAVASETLNEADWKAEVAKLGPAQPVARLQWLGGLLSGNPTHGAFRLRKWPQIEREYPRHFRIATIMMKSAANVADIAQAAGVPEEEVRDFINANLATGYAVNAKADAEAPQPAPAPAAPASSRPASGVSSLFGRRKK